MSRLRILATALLLLVLVAPVSHAQLGKNVPIPANSDLDHELTAIANATDPAQKLKLLDEFAKAHPESDYQIIADEQYVNYYLSAKQYDKTFEYGDKLFSVDPDNYANAVNMIRAANEKGDTDKLFTYGEKANAILKSFKDSPAPAGTDADSWQRSKEQKLESIKDNQEYVRQSLLSAANNARDNSKKAGYFERFGKLYPATPEGAQALTIAAATYQQAQNRAKMLDVANSALTLNPDNIGMLLLLANDFGERREQLDKAEAYAKKAAALSDNAKKPENISDDQWKQQLSIQKGLALSTLGQISIAKKLDGQAVDSLTKAAPMLKGDPVSYARNQYRLGFAYLNLKKNAEAQKAFTDAASVDSPYKGPSQEKINQITAAHKKPA